VVSEGREVSKEIVLNMSQLPRDFDRARLKVERASKHATELVELLRRWSLDGRERLVVQEDLLEDGVMLTFRALQVDQRETGLILGDITNNPRAALDYVWAALERTFEASFEPELERARRPKSYFPIRPTKDGCLTGC
jgi:hypothetical protein